MARSTMVDNVVKPVASVGPAAVEAIARPSKTPNTIPPALEFPCRTATQTAPSRNKHKGKVTIRKTPSFTRRPARHRT
jgi:hypothetical protein